MLDLQTWPAEAGKQHEQAAADSSQLRAEVGWLTTEAAKAAETHHVELAG